MKLSIITINYNNKAGLQKTIDSVACQTWRDFEWIVIDGGSTDGSKELIEQNQQHFAYWCSEPDKGVYNAMNKGITHSKGEYMLFLNSGDVLYDDKVLETVFCRDLTGDLVYGDWYKILDGGTVMMKAPSRISVGFFYSDNICHQAMFIRSSVLKTAGYDESFKVYADYARWMRMCLDGASFQYVPVVVCMFDARDGLSHQINDEELNRIRDMVPPYFRVDIEEKLEEEAELSEYRNNEFVQEIVLLMRERPLFCRLVHINILCMKALRRILGLLHI